MKGHGQINGEIKFCQRIEVLSSEMANLGRMGVSFFTAVCSVGAAFKLHVEIPSISPGFRTGYADSPGAKPKRDEHSYM